MTSDDLSEVIRTVEAAQAGQPPVPTDSAAFRTAVDRLVLGAPRKYNWREFTSRTGRDEESIRTLWRAVGFPLLDEDQRIFTDNDVAAEQMLHQMTETGLLTPGDTEAVARAIAQTLARLADWQVTMLHRVLAERLNDVPAAQALELAAAALPMLERAQNLVWRRHLDAAISRRILTSEPLADVQDLSVGFADLVGFTRLSRSLPPVELNQLLDRFEECVSSVIVDELGQVVKTVGDEVLFVAESPIHIARIARAMHVRQLADPVLPLFRIGLASGSVLSRYGDVFGESVNRASRLTALADPGRTLADGPTAAALAGRDEWTTSRVGIKDLAGIGDTEIWTLE